MFPAKYLHVEQVACFGVQLAQNVIQFKAEGTTEDLGGTIVGWIYVLVVHEHHENAKFIHSIIVLMLRLINLAGVGTTPIMPEPVMK